MALISFSNFLTFKSSLTMVSQVKVIEYINQVLRKSSLKTFWEQILKAFWCNPVND